MKIPKLVLLVIMISLTICTSKPDDSFPEILIKHIDNCCELNKICTFNSSILFKNNNYNKIFVFTKGEISINNITSLDLDEYLGDNRVWILMKDKTLYRYFLEVNNHVKPSNLMVRDFKYDKNYIIIDPKEKLFGTKFLIDSKRKGSCKYFSISKKSFKY